MTEHILRVAHWPPLTGDAHQDNAIRQMSAWTADQREQAFHAAYPDPRVREWQRRALAGDRTALQDVEDAFGPVDHALVRDHGIQMGFGNPDLTSDPESP